MPLQKEKMDCFVAALLAMTVQQSPSLRANESHACARRAQRGNPCLSVIASAAKQSISPRKRKNGLLRRCAPRNDGATISVIASQRVARMRPTGSAKKSMPLRHCERSEAIHLAAQRKNGLLRRYAPRNDGATISVIASQRVA
jgi:hypothetical protein